MFCVEAYPKAGTLLYPSQLSIVYVALLYSLILYVPLLCSSTVDFKVEKMPRGISYPRTLLPDWVLICTWRRHSQGPFYLRELRAYHCDVSMLSSIVDIVKKRAAQCMYLPLV
jgi:hypothetical protein